MQRGHQCGMLWGADAGGGSRSFPPPRRTATGPSARPWPPPSAWSSHSRRRTGSVNCRDITGCDLAEPFGSSKYFLTGQVLHAASVSKAKWAPEAIGRRGKDWTAPDADPSPGQRSAALPRSPGKWAPAMKSMVMVAGFGRRHRLERRRLRRPGRGDLDEHPGLVPGAPREKRGLFKDPEAKKYIAGIHGRPAAKSSAIKYAGGVSKRRGEHTEFIKNGGCDKLVQVLARSQSHGHGVEQMEFQQIKFLKHLWRFNATSISIIMPRRASAAVSGAP